MHQKRNRQIHKIATQAVASFLGIYMLHSCANIGNPEGGPYDMTPPRLVKASPKPGALEVSGKRINLHFDEFVKLAQGEEVIISPPQLKSPRVNAIGKEIDIRLEDSLKPNTTYSIYFGNAIVDNNEDNPLEDFGYTFSTGTTLDSMRISGVVLDAETLEPVSSLIVGAYPSEEFGDSTLFKQTIPYASRTSKSGRFSVRGLKSASYRLMALQDNDNNLLYSGAGEGMAFDEAIRQTTLLDSIKTDTIRIDSIVRRDTLYRDSLVTYAHTYYYPDDVVLRYFLSSQKKQGLDRSSRADSLRIELEFHSRPDSIPVLHFLGHTGKSPSDLYHPTRNGSDITYWLRDPELISADSIRCSLSYMHSDSTGAVSEKLDTLTFYKPKARKVEKKKEDAPQLCELSLQQSKGILSGTLADSLILSSKQPLERIPEGAIRLEERVDSTTRPVPFVLEPLPDDGLSYLFRFGRAYGSTYLASVDSAALVSIYGIPTTGAKLELKIMQEDELGGVRLTIAGIEGDVFVQLLDKSDNVLQTQRALRSTAEAGETSPLQEGELAPLAPAEEGKQEKPSTTYTVVFKDLKPEEYYARLYIDGNGDGVWTTGLYPALQPEEVYYYPQVLAVKKSFTTDEVWMPLSVPLPLQKPDAIKKNKPEEKKKRVDKNIEYYRNQDNKRRKK